MQKFFLTCSLLLLFSKISKSQLQNGPMPGYAEMREVAIWVQTSGPHEVYIRYGKNGNFENQTKRVNTSEKRAFCTTLIADKVEPGTTYQYQLFIDGKYFPLEQTLQFKTPPLWQYRTAPPLSLIHI